MSKKCLLIILGARKAGSTSLYQNIIDRNGVHPLRYENGQIQKEPHFFALKDKFCEKSIQWYKNMIGDKKGWYVDASTSYMPNEILKSTKYLKMDKKFMVIIREPVERLVSSYLHNRRRGVEKRPFEDIVKVTPNNLEGSVKAEQESVRRAVRNNRIDEDYLRGERLKRLPVPNKLQSFKDHLWPFKYFRNSYYSKRLRDFFESRADIQVLFTKNMKQNPKLVDDKVCNHLNIKIGSSNFKHKHRASRCRPIWATIMREKAKQSRIGSWLSSQEWLKAIINSVEPKTSKSDFKNKYEYEISACRELFSEEYRFWSQKEDCPW